MGAALTVLLQGESCGVWACTAAVRCGTTSAASTSAAQSTPQETFPISPPPPTSEHKMWCSDETNPLYRRTSAAATYAHASTACTWHHSPNGEREMEVISGAAHL